MENFKLKIDLLPKGAWNNDFSKTLPQKEWDLLRTFCYKRANNRCEICGCETSELNAHEMWEFDIKTRTQTLKNIIAICTKCHGVIHFKNSVRLGFEKQAKEHFIKINKCSEMDFAGHLLKALDKYEERNKIYRWKIVAELKKFGGKENIIINNNITLIDNPYKDITLNNLNYEEYKNNFLLSKQIGLTSLPRVIDINVDNYQGIIFVDTLYVDKIEWFVDDIKIKTKYNTIGRLRTDFKVKEINGKKLYFKLTNKNGYTISKTFVLSKTYL